MKVSIIIPVYNAEKYVEEYINSALSQNYKNIEIIAVDDGSTDNSLQILQKYSDKIKVISKKNGGTPTALNEGIKIMTGEWFKWLSADDVLNKNCIEVLVNEIEKLSDNAKNCIFYSNYEYIDENSKIIGEFIEPNYNCLKNFDRNVILLDHFFGNGSTCIIHKSIFSSFGLFDENIGYQEDYEFWLRCCLLYNTKLHLIPQKLVKYRIHQQQLTQKKLAENISHSDIVRNKILDLIDPALREEYNNSLHNFQKQYKLRIKIRRKFRNIMLKTFPENISQKILKTYSNRKNK